jgi:hypothetical protein
MGNIYRLYRLVWPEMASRTSIAWSVVFLVLAALAIPWFRWQDATMVAGLPGWLWWHIAWMGAASAMFALFARRDWGLFVEVER